MGGSEDHFAPSDFAVGVRSPGIGYPGLAREFAVRPGSHLHEERKISFDGLKALEHMLKFRISQ